MQVGAQTKLPTGEGLHQHTVGGAAFAVGVILAITAPLALLVAPKEPQIVRQQSYLPALIAAIRFNKPFRLYAGAAAANGLSDGLFSAVVFLYQAQYMGFARIFWLVLIVYIGSNLLALPVWAAVVRRIGKHRAWALGLGLTALCYPPIAFLKPEPQSFPIMLALVARAGAAYSVANVATLAVLGAVADYELLRSRISSAGGLFAIQALISKFNIAVGTGLAFLIIAAFDRGVTACMILTRCSG